MSDPSAQESLRLFVGGVPQGVTANEVQKLFTRVPGVKAVEVDPLRPVGCPGSTYTFVQIHVENETAARKCVSIFDKSSWKGGKLKVESSKPRFDVRLRAEQENARMREAFTASWKKERGAKLEAKRIDTMLNPRDLRIRGPRGKGVFKITTASCVERIAKLEGGKKLKHGNYICAWKDVKPKLLDDLAIHHTKAAKKSIRLLKEAEAALLAEAETNGNSTAVLADAAAAAVVVKVAAAAVVPARPQPGAVRGRNARHEDQEKALAAMQESGDTGTVADWMFDDEDRSEEKQQRKSSGPAASEFDSGIVTNEDKNSSHDDDYADSSMQELIAMPSSESLGAENDNALALLESLMGGGGGGGDDDKDADSSAVQAQDEKKARPSVRRAAAKWAVVQQYDPTSENAAELEVKVPEPESDSDNEDEDNDGLAQDEQQQEKGDTAVAEEESTNDGGFKFGFMSPPVVDADGEDATNDNTTLRSIFQSSFDKKEEDDTKTFRFGEEATSAQNDAGGNEGNSSNMDVVGGGDVSGEKELVEQSLEDMPTFAQVMMALNTRWQSTWGDVCPGASFVRKGGEDGQGQDAERAWLEQRSELTQDFRRKRKVALKQGLGSKRGRRGGGGGGGRGARMAMR